MSRTVAVTWVLAALLSSGCSLSMYERGLIRRVDAHKTVTQGAVTAKAARTLQGEPAVALRRGADVELERQRVYQTIVSEAGWAPWMEPLELITAPLYLPITILLAIFALDDTDDRKMPASSRLKIAFAPINPAVSIFGMTLRRTEISDEEHFRDPPTKMRFAMHMPLVEVQLRWQVLDANGRALAEGEGRTDAFGQLVLPAEAAGKRVRVTGEGISSEIALP